MDNFDWISIDDLEAHILEYGEYSVQWVAYVDFDGVIDVTPDIAGLIEDAWISGDVDRVLILPPLQEELQ